ncbi:MAG: CPBP family intramembrane glutamic endopeptidase [Myxococcota bacterium]
MIAQYGIHRVAFFYAGIYLLAVVVARLADVPNIITLHDLTPPEILLRLGAGVAAGGMLAAAWLAAARFSPTARRVDALLVGVVGPIGGSDALILALLSGLAEEVLFRGAIQPAAGLGTASVLFTLAHLPPHRDLWPWTISAGVMGLGFGLATLATQDVLFAVATHTTINAINLRRLGLLALEHEGHTHPGG